MCSSIEPRSGLATAFDCILDPSPRFLYGLKLLAIAYFFCAVTAFLYLRVTSVDGRDRFGNTLFPDFAQLFVAGEIVRAGDLSQLYHQQSFFDRTAAVLNEGKGSGFYSLYPPPTGYLVAPFSYFEYPTAARLFFAANLFLAILLGHSITRHFFKEDHIRSLAFWLFLASVPTCRTLFFGQNSILSLGILWGAFLLWRSGWGFIAGSVIALGIAKPQLFWGVWLWTLLIGPFRLRLGLICGIITLAGIPILDGNFGIWNDWFNALTLAIGLPDNVRWMVSLPHAIQIVTGSETINPRVQQLLLPFIAICGAAYYFWKIRKSSTESQLIFLMLGSLIISPRLYQYDLLLVVPLIAAACTQLTTPPKALIALTLIGFWIHEPVTYLHIPLLTLIGLAWLLWHSNWLQLVQGTKI